MPPGRPASMLKLGWVQQRTRVHRARRLLQSEYGTQLCNLGYSFKRYMVISPRATRSVSSYLGAHWRLSFGGRTWRRCPARLGSPSNKPKRTSTAFQSRPASRTGVAPPQEWPADSYWLRCPAMLREVKSQHGQQEPKIGLPVYSDATHSCGAKNPWTPESGRGR